MADTLYWILTYSQVYEGPLVLKRQYGIGIKLLKLYFKQSPDVVTAQNNTDIFTRENLKSHVKKRSFHK